MKVGLLYFRERVRAKREAEMKKACYGEVAGFSTLSRVLVVGPE